MNVVNSRDLFASGICQNPEFASSLLNTLAPDSWARVSSTFGRGCFSLFSVASGLHADSVCS